VLQKLIDKCEEEINWAQANIDEMNEKGGYAKDDVVWLPCWLKAYKEILDFITSQSGRPKNSAAEKCINCKRYENEAIMYMMLLDAIHRILAGEKMSYCNGPGIKGNREYWPCEYKDRGYRLATYGDIATHAICRCGFIAKINDDSHSCSWTKLVKP